MFRKISLLNIIIFVIVIAAALILTGFTFSRAIEEKGKNSIVDLHGEHWDVTQAESIMKWEIGMRKGEVGSWKLEVGIMGMRKWE